MTIRVLVVDDHPALRAIVCSVLMDVPGFHVVGEAADGGEAIRLAADLTPDVAVMDIAMPGMSGIEAVAELQRSAADVKVLGLSMHADAVFVRCMMDAGARGYVLKNCAAEELPDAVRAVNDGRIYLSTELPSQLRDFYQ